MIPAVSAATGGGAGGLPYLWIQAGTSGQLYTSTSTTFANGSWTSRTSSFGSTVINRVASNGQSLYVAVGGAGKLATSPDGTTWTQQTSSFNAGDSIASVAYGNGYCVAVGDNAKVAYSTNGTTWTQKTTGITGNLYSVAYGNGLWVIGNSTGSMYTATDPTGTWTSRTSTLGVIADIHYFKAQSIWVAGNDSGTTGALASSTDGLTWTARTSALNFSTSGSVSCAFASNSSVCVAGAYTALLTCDAESSTNGTTWTSRTLADQNTVGVFAASDDAGLLVMNGKNTSSDGITWSSRTVPFTNVLTICHSSGMPSNR